MPKNAPWRLPEDDVALAIRINTVYREAVLATRDLEYPTYHNLSFYLGVPLGTVKSRLNRGRVAIEALRQKDGGVQQQH